MREEEEEAGGERVEGRRGGADSRAHANGRSGSTVMEKRQSLVE